MAKTPTTRTSSSRRSPGKASARASRPRRQRRNDTLLRDVLSLGLVALGGYSLIAILWPAAAGPWGAGLAGLLHGVAGRGAFFIPTCLLVVGGLLIADPARVCFDELSGAVALLFLSYVSLAHVYGVPAGLPFEKEVPMHPLCGGWIGSVVGGSLRGWIGDVGAYILLLVVAAVGLLLIVDRPLPELLQSLSDTAGRGMETLGQARGMLPQRPAREKSAPRPKPAANGGKRGAIPDEELPGRGGGAPLAEDLPEPAISTVVADEPPARNGKNGRKKRGKAPLEPEAEAAGLPSLFDEPEAEPEVVELPPVVAWHEAGAQSEASEPAEAVAADPEAEAVESRDGAEEGAGESAPAGKPLESYDPPATTLLEYAQVLPEGPGAVTDNARNIKILEDTLAQFKIDAKVVEIAQGPTFTRYEIRLAPGIRVGRIESLGDNIAMNLAALDVRIQAPIPGKAAIGIEVPNKTMAAVSLREVLEAPEFRDAPSRLTFALGKDVTGKAWTADLTRMPHLLIGGATNSGKSVCLNCLIASILFRARPDEVKFLLIDPKRVELSLFDGIPHLIYPVITDIKKAAGMLNWSIQEMERRYDLFVKAGSRDINSYNRRAQEEDLEHLPYIVIVVDELADLMMQVAAEVEQSICRLAQLARATGIHLVIATQRPSVDVITGLIKANISSRIAFAVSSHIDSRTILDKRGAERLLGRGDMLFDPIGASKPVRVQGAYLSEKEVETLVEYLRRQATPTYTAKPIEVPTTAGGPGGAGGGSDDAAEDGVFEDAVRLVVTTRRASTSMLQRKFSIGYTRAARLIDMMEERGIVSALDGAKPREVLASREQIEQFFRSPLNAPSQEEDAAVGGEEG